jgi:phage baseplate assembly protein W
MKGDEFSGLVFYDENGMVFSKSEFQLIGENIKRILNTRKGERVGEPDFGSNVMTYLFMPDMLCSDLIAEIISSIQRNEPRVIVNNCTLKSAGQDDIVRIELDLTLRSNRENFKIGVTL